MACSKQTISEFG